MNSCFGKAAGMAAVLAFGLALSGCGGGAPVHPVDRIARSADTLLVSDVLVSVTGVEDVRARASCSGRTCTLAVDDETASLALDVGATGYSASDFAGTGTWLAATETRRGVSLFEGAGQERGDTSFVAARVYGGWLDHGFFLVANVSARDADELHVELPLGASVGSATVGERVRGGAAWSGVMVGVDVSQTETRSNRIRGDADLAFADLAGPKLDVAFTNVVDLDDGGRRRDDMKWHDVPVAGGGFGTGSDGNSVRGRFHGPDHAEVGGVFERDDVIGAFGARRE